MTQQNSFCNDPAFNDNLADKTYKKQPFINLSQGVGIYDTRDFAVRYADIAQQFIKGDEKCNRSYVLYVPAGITFDMCVALPTVLNNNTQINDLYIIVQQRSSITISHDLLGDSRNAITIFLEPHAQLICIQKNRHAVRAHNHIVCYQQAQSIFSWYGWYEKEIHNYLDVVLQGEHAKAYLYNGFVGNHITKQWLHTKQHHQAGHTESTSITKGMHKGHSQVTHLGMIRIEKDAQQVCANLQSQFMLMDQKAKAHTIPSLQVLANEVQCAHGSAIGYFDDESLFYLQARGLQEEEYLALLEDAFFADVRLAV